MTVPLRDVLAHPALLPADPRVRAGAGSLDRPVRWVHSSEVLEIAPLLRGGELLLTGGVVLASTDAATQRRYVRDLAACGVAGVAIETGTQLPEVPEALLRAAGELEFPVVELTRVVPFVSIAEAVNAAMVNDSVRGLRAAAELSHRLSGELAAGGGPQELVDALAELQGCEVALLDTDGGVLGSTAAGPEDALALQARRSTVSVPVVAHGTAVARLVVAPGDAAAGPGGSADPGEGAGSGDGPEPGTLDAVLDRAAEIFSLAVARTGALTPQARARRELLRLVCDDEPAPERVAAVARAAGLPDPVCAVGVVAQGAGDLVGVGAVDAVLRSHGRQVLTTVTGGTLVGLVALPADAAPAGRERLLDDLRGHRRLGRTRVGVGPTAVRAARFAHTVTEARRCVDAADENAWPAQVVDAVDAGVELLLRTVTPAAAAEFVDDQLGPLLALGARKARPLVETLEVYFRQGCSKTRTARELHLQRQTLYQRLDRIFGALGGDPTGTPRVAGLHLAARLYTGAVDP